MIVANRVFVVEVDERSVFGAGKPHFLIHRLVRAGVVRSLKYPLTIERTVIEEYIQEYTKYGIFLDEMMLRQLKIYGINVKD